MILLPLLSIPSPSDPLIVELGIFKLRWYGTLIAIGILIAGWLASRELDRRGYPPGRAYTIATWCIPARRDRRAAVPRRHRLGRFSGHLDKIPMLQEGGLGMPGVIVGGAIGAAIGARRAKVPVLEAFDVVAPGLILAQAIGRWGNWFNQELFGGPTDLPWGLEIDPAHRPAEYADQPTFHPTFLYESLWNLLVFVILMRLNKRLWLRAPAGTVFAAVPDAVLDRPGVHGEPAHRSGAAHLRRPLQPAAVHRRGHRRRHLVLREPEPRPPR